MKGIIKYPKNIGTQKRSVVHAYLVHVEKILNAKYNNISHTNGFIKFLNDTYNGDRDHTRSFNWKAVQKYTLIDKLVCFYELVSF